MASNQITIIDRKAKPGEHKLPGTPDAGQTVCHAFDVSDPLKPVSIARISPGTPAQPAAELRNKKCVNLVYLRVGTPGQALSTSHASRFEQEMDVGMGRMVSAVQSSGFSGNVDVDFLAVPIPHHRGALHMVRLVLQHGVDLTSRTLAEEVIAGQAIEIQSMQRRRSTPRRVAHEALDAEKIRPLHCGLLRGAHSAEMAKSPNPTNLIRLIPA